MRRALFLVTAASALMMGGTVVASAQANLDAGKSPAQIFAQGCSACHRSPQELAYVSRDFLLEHYTTGPRQADAMASYLEMVRSARAVKPRRSPSAAADSQDVVSTGSIEVEPTMAAKDGSTPAPAVSLAPRPAFDE